MKPRELGNWWSPALVRDVTDANPANNAASRVSTLLAAGDHGQAHPAATISRSNNDIKAVMLLHPVEPAVSAWTQARDARDARASNQ